MTYYQDIFTIPIYNWFKVMSVGSFGFLNVDSTFIQPKKVNQDTSEHAANVWFDLNDQFIDEFGQDESTLDLLEKKRDLGLLKASYCVTGDKFKLTQIELKEFELEMFENDEAFNPNKEIGIISKYLGRMIDIRKTSVHQYYTIKKILQDG